MMNATDLMEIVAGIVAGALACEWSGPLEGSLPLRNILVFTAIKVAGDLSRAVLGRRSTYYLEDLLGDCVLYWILAIVSAAVTWVVARYLGAAVEPLFPGVAAHIMLTLVPERERRLEAAGPSGLAERK